MPRTIAGARAANNNYAIYKIPAVVSVLLIGRTAEIIMIRTIPISGLILTPVPWLVG